MSTLTASSPLRRPADKSLAIMLQICLLSHSFHNLSAYISELSQGLYHTEDAMGM